MSIGQAGIEVPRYKIKPETRLGYQLGLNRNEPYKERRPDRNIFASESGTRMAGERLINLYGIKAGEEPLAQVRGSELPSRFTKTLRLSIPRLDLTTDLLEQIQPEET